MCDYCHSFPHIPGCPNEDEPSVMYICEEDDCGNEIYEGDSYFEINGKVVCSDCIYNYQKTAGSDDL